MLYFCFNDDEFVALQEKNNVIKFDGRKPIHPAQQEICTVSLGDIEGYFFDKLRNEIQLSEVGTISAVYDIIGIPIGAFSVDDEKIGNLDGVLKFALSEYAKLPIKELDNKSLNDVGIKIEFCKRILNDEVEKKIQDDMQKNSLDCVMEKVLWKNMTDNEKKEQFSEYLSAIASKDNELIIVDPYIFYSVEDEYCDILRSVLELSKAKTIIVITDAHNYRQASYDRISQNIKVEVKYSNCFHDRFWIANREKGFYTGTSFNGIGKKISLINILSKEDVKEIVGELTTQVLN